MLPNERDVRAPLTRKNRELWRAAERGLPTGADHTEIYRYLKALKLLRFASGPCACDALRF